MWHPGHSAFFFFQAEDGIRDLIVTGVQTCALPISIDLLFGPAERQDRPSVLPRDREGAGSGLGRLKPVEERGPAEAGWRRAQPGDADERRRRVLHARRVADDPGVRGPAPREDGGMAGCGLRDRVILVGLREDRPLLEQEGQPAGELRAVAIEIIGGVALLLKQGAGFTEAEPESTRL